MYKIDQRWLSQNEPELGLGLVERIQNRMVLVYFPAKEIAREYEFNDAPLTRAKLHIGAEIKDIDGNQLTVESIREDENSCFIYTGQDLDIHEKDLSSSLDLSSPEKRLLSSDVDHPRHFDLRLEALNAKKRWLSSPVRGLMGGRILLFPHQLYLSHNLEDRHRIRALLADEVGLGKTIEAGLIIHRSIMIGRVERVLVIVPPALSYAWFAELYLRFNLSFRVLDDTMLNEIQQGCGIQLKEIPLLICPRDKMNELDLIEETWEMLVVDEVHQFEPETEDFQSLQKLSHEIHHTLLLSATPDQDGAEAHFQRLNCLDPEAFSNWQEHQDQMSLVKEAADLATSLQKEDSQIPSEKICKKLLSPWEPETGWKSFLKEENYKEVLLQRLMDRHALGRLMNRNTRKGIGGFPKRTSKLILLERSDKKKHKKEFLQNQGLEKEFKLAHYEKDERLEILVELSQANPGDKFLVLCHHRLKTEAIVRALESMGLPHVAKFHEGMSLMERDRQAAWFQEAKGPSILVSSPLGAEGRNFQMAKHLFLFDQPLMPEALEQWIGRLDRIGQGREIFIYTPVIEDSLQHRLFQCHEKLEVYHQAYRGSQYTHGKVLIDLLDTLQKDSAAFQVWLASLESQHKDIMSELEQSRDVLMELLSYNDDVAQGLVESVELMDDDPELERWMELAWDNYGIESKKIRHQTYGLHASDAYAIPFPGFKETGMSVTFDRLQALKRDDVTFLTWDHPMVQSALDMVMSGKLGNSSLVKTYAPKVGIIVEAIFIVHNSLSSKLRADRFFPMEPIHIAMDKDLETISKETLDSFNYYKVEPKMVLSNPKVGQHLQLILEKLKDEVQEKVPKLISHAKHNMQEVYDEAIDHLKYLKQINPSFNESELQSYIKEKEALENGLDQTIIRLDSLRLIACFPKK